MADDVDPDKLEIADELIAERRSAAPGELPDDMNSMHRKIIGAIDTFNGWVGNVVAWIVVPLCLAMVYEVIVRKYGTSPSVWWDVFTNFITASGEEADVTPKPTAWAYDISRFLYGASFMLGAGYALSKGVHIRADFLYRHWSDRAQGIIDLLLYCTLFMFGMAGLLYSGFEFFLSSVTSPSNPWYSPLSWERANDTAWAPYLWPVRICIPLGAFFLMLQGLSEILKSWYAATRGRWPV